MTAIECLRHVTAAAASAVIYWWAAVAPGAGWVSCIAFLPLLLSIRKHLDYRSSILSGLVFSTTWASLTLEWIARMGFHDGQIDSHAIGWMLLVGMFVALYSTATTALYYLWNVRHWPCAVAFTITWLAAEVTADCFMQTALGLTVDAFRLATSQIDGGIMTQCADLGGAVFVGGLVTAFNGLIVDLMQRNQTSRFVHFRRGMLLLLALAITYHGLRPLTCLSKTGPSVVLIPGKWANTAASVTIDSTSGARLLVWPEIAHPGILGVNGGVECDLAVVADRCNASVIAGCQRFSHTTGQLYNSACLVVPDGAHCESSDKRFLGPISEFIPPLGKWLCLSEPPVQYASGRAACWNLAGEYRIGVGICNDATFSLWARSLMKLNPDFFVVIANESFSPSSQMRKQVLSISRLRAVETRRTFVRCALSGSTCVINAFGQVIAHTPAIDDSRPLVVSDVPLTSATSTYVAIGDSISAVIACIAILIGECVGRSTLKEDHATFEARIYTH